MYALNIPIQLKDLQFLKYFFIDMTLFKILLPGTSLLFISHVHSQDLVKIPFSW